jgi:N-acetylglutamate synthase-like GNAT family acetyltransferase
MTAHIRDMTKRDVDSVGDVLYEAFKVGALKHGYASRIKNVQEARSWAWAMLHHGPNDLLVAEVEGRVVGVCCLNRRGDLGGIGPVAVQPGSQGHGIGRQLMDALLARTASLQSLRLFQEAFNPASFSLYYSLDFVPVADLLDLFLNGGVKQDLDPCSDVSELTVADLETLHQYDSPRSRCDRQIDFRYYLNWGKIFVCRRQSQIRGFLACLPGSGFVQLGPLLAEGEGEGERLFRHALSVFKKRNCRARVMAKNHSLVKTLEESGFKIYCIGMLMVRGTWHPGQYVEAFGIFPEGT